MSKRIVVSLTVFVVCVGAAFAGGAPESETTAAPLGDIELEGVEILLWLPHTRSRGDGLAEIIEEFNATNPYGITVVGEYAGRYNDIYNKMITGLAGGVVPSLVAAYQNQAGAYMLADGLVDIEPYIEDATYGLSDAERADFIEGIYESDYNAQFDNMRLGFPPNRSMEVMYYNADWLRELGYDAPPRTWDEFAEMAIAATDSDEGTYGYAVSTGASNLFSLAISRGGDGYLNAAEDAYEFTTPEIVAGLELMKELYDRGAAQKIAERFGEQTDFANRRALFTMGSTSGLPFYRSAVEESEVGPFEWSVAAIPHSTPRPVMNMYGASWSIPATTPEQQLAAWLFVKYMTEVEVQREWVDASGYFPVRASAREGLGDYFVENTQYSDAFEVLLSADVKTEPPFASYEEVRRLISATFNDVLDGADIAAALEELTDEANLINADMLP